MNKALIGITGGIVAATIGAAALIIQSINRSQNQSKSITLRDMILEKGGGFLGIDDKDEAYLAEALEIDLEHLRNAKDTAWQEALQQALHNEMITQAQADMLQEKTGDHTFGMFSRWIIEGGAAYRNHLAEALGISIDNLSKAQTTAEMLKRGCLTVIEPSEANRHEAASNF